jgi:uncharacterized protein YbaR (Trm112 family)
MHLLLTDRLSCPRCGPSFGLILRADRLESRAVLEGVLGCPNCRDAFPVVDGFADLRAPPRRALPAGLAGAPSASAGRDASAGTDVAAPEDGDERAERLVALLGVVRGPGTIALVGEPARLAAAVAARVEDVQLVAVDPDMRFWPEGAGVTRLASGPGLPFFGSGMRAVAVDGRLGWEVLAEAARVVVPKGRVVIEHALDGTSERVHDVGLSVVAAQAGTVVATRG